MSARETRFRTIRMTRMSGAVAVFAVAILALAAPSAHALEIKRMTLSNGAVLLVSEEQLLPMVTVSIAFDAGARRDPRGKEGLARLTAECIAQGTKELTAAQFNQKVDFMGSAVSVGVGRDYANADLTSLVRYLPDTLHLLAGILTEPGLRDADIERKRAEQVAEIKSNEEQPGYVADVTFVKMLFGDSPYGHSAEGTADSVSKLSADDIRGFYHDQYKLGSAVIAVVGDVNAAEVKASLEKELAGLAGTVTPQPEPPPVSVGPGIHADLVDRNVAQANVILGFGGIARANPDFYKLQVMNYILGGGGFVSRLVQVVRSKAGLAYSVGSGFDAGRFPGAFTVVLQTKNKSANEALNLVLQQLREIQEKPVTDAELEDAKKFLVGSFPLKFDRQSSIASFMLQVELYGLGLDYADRYPKLIDAVTRDDVLKVAREYLHPDSAIVVAVANQKQAAIDTASFEKPSGGSGGGAN
ncbi:MAG TPA: pitrilysin family protein [Candidatus Binataceae bacterium]